jgi:hypothetical protein
LTAEAIYIDFEGSAKDSPTLLGVLISTSGEETFTQYVLEEDFHRLVPDVRHPQLLISSLSEILQVLDREHPTTPVYAWSTHEQTLINEMTSGNPIHDNWSARVIDAKKIASTWVRKQFPNHEFKRTSFRGTHTLDQYLSFTGYTVPHIHGPGLTGRRIAALRKALLKDQPVQEWSRGKKTAWTNLLRHNEHDCRGMKHIIDTIADSQ